MFLKFLEREKPKANNKSATFPFFFFFVYMKIIRIRETSAFVELMGNNKLIFDCFSFGKQSNFIDDLFFM